MSFTERRAWRVWIALMSVAGCSACSQRPSPTDAAIDAEETLSSDATHDAGVRPDGGPSDARVLRDAGPDEVQWFQEGEVCAPLSVATPPRPTPRRCLVAGCLDVTFGGPRSAEEIRRLGTLVLFDDIFLYSQFDERDFARTILGPVEGRVSATNTVCGGETMAATRSWLSPQRSAVLCEDLDRWSLRIIDSDQRRQCTIATARRAVPIERGSGGLRRLRNAWAWHENFQRAKDDVVILEDNAPVRRRLTDQFGVKTMHVHNDRLYWFETNWTQGGSSLRVSEAPYRTVDTLWTSALPVHRMSADINDPSRVVFEVARGDEVAANHGDIFFADLDTIDTVPPRNLTNDAGSQFWPLVLGDRVVFTDISRSTVRPDGAPSEDHDRWDLVLLDLPSGTRRIVYSNEIRLRSVPLHAPRRVRLLEQRPGRHAHPRALRGRKPDCASSAARASPVRPR